MMIINRVCWLLGFILWIALVLTIVIPLLYWILSGKDYGNLIFELDKIIDE